MNLLAKMKEKTAFMALSGLLLAALSFLFLVITEKNYKVSTDYLIVQNQSGSQDFYTLSKSAEYIGKVLNEGVYSELFIDEVVKTGKVNAEFLPFDKKDKLKQWSKIVKVNRNAELGILSIEVFDNDKRQAANISDAIADVLTNKNNLFRGEGQNINVKVLSGPVTEKNPSITNIAAAMIGGFVLGFLLSAMSVYYQAIKVPRIQGRGTIVFQGNTDVTKERMANSGIFADADDYRESLKYLEK
jgi:capsular polysaccharide biosynthesis protein